MLYIIQDNSTYNYYVKTVDNWSRFDDDIRDAKRFHKKSQARDVANKIFKKESDYYILPIPVEKKKRKE